ncbi:hypothetical protein [Cupriavidus taiwanensis]|uniref:Uncharacterized protein n=1 Tax=Cupriavidus taiwanensis TaxID=164546 RepID=A0A375JCX0_9BURK|nr:hypothetical protein [Cupriavidus taiwanensis]SPS02411.1 hypothetical protein CBM2634_U10022 [Cupriavidus taiwanensis]
MKASAEFSVHYEDADFLETCDGLFARNQEFIIMQGGKCSPMQEGGRPLLESQRPRGRWENLKMLAKLGSAGMRALN